MSVKKVLQIESDVVTSKSIQIDFEFKKGTFPADKNPGDFIVIKPITVRNWLRMKPLLLSIEKEDREALIAKTENPYNDDIAELMNKYDETVFEIVCIGIHNGKGIMPDWFRQTLLDNCTFEDLFILLNAILFRIGCNPFINSITAIAAVSPMDEAETIALQENAKSWNKPNPSQNQKAASCS